MWGVGLNVEGNLNSVNAGELVLNGNLESLKCW